MTDAANGPTTVLVVDDEHGIRQALDRFLTRQGYRVVQAEDAPTALNRLKAENPPPQAMLCDVRMPNTSGVDLVPRALAEQPDLAIIMLTAIDEPRTAIECLKLGASDYLLKPIDLEELEVSLQSALRKRQLEIDRRELERWLANEVALRTRELETRTDAVTEVALAALAAAAGWTGADEAVGTLARVLGTAREAVLQEIARRRG